MPVGAPRLKRERGLPDSARVPASHFILLIDDETASTGALVAQLVRIGIEPIRVADLAEAVEVVKSKEYSIRAVLLPSHLPGSAVRKAMKSMRRREPVLPAMVYGKAPDRAQRKLLQKADVLLAIWDGYDEGMLRFQINRLVSGDGNSSVRTSRRAPVHAPVRIIVGGREKQGTLYSLSEGGCFIETPRASMDGARLHLVFDAGGIGYSLDGTVAFSNVPGNLQRPNLPLGMGVRFDDLDEEARWKLADFIRDRMDALEV
jgi:CheY-like chemotaxis protein